MVAAGSSNPKYDLVTPKYFEICAAGALLIGQSCQDLEPLGFNTSNAIIFNKSDFNDQIQDYRSNPEQFLRKRLAGRRLIEERHLISHRITQLRTLFQQN